MFKEIFMQAWTALRRNPTRSFLTSIGIIWGIVAVTLLIAYGSGFRFVLVRSFEAFGKGAVVAWPGQTSSQAGGERAGKKVRFEQADVDSIKAEATMVKQVCLETVRWSAVSYGERSANAPVRGVCPEYGEMRNEVASVGRWITASDLVERRRVVFIGDELKKDIFGTKPAIGEHVTINGLRFMVIGVMAKKMQMSNYFGPDDGSAFVPYSTAGDMWNNRYGSTMVFTAVTPDLEQKAMDQVRGIVAKRQGFAGDDQRAMRMFGRQQARPIIDGITIGLQVLLTFVGALTLGIGGVGVMNIMLVSVDERIREIGLRRAIGARKWHIRAQFLAEAMVIVLLGGMVGIVLAYGFSAIIGPLPMLGAVMDDDSGQGDIHLRVSFMTVLVSTGILFIVGIVSGLVPAIRASRLNPVEALRYE